MKIEILYFDGCPNHGPTVDRVKEALRQEGLTADVSETNVEDDTAARTLGFLGSPSIRIAGLDVEPSARLSKAFGMMCRTYSEGGRQVGLPPLELISTALREAVGPLQVAHGCCEAAAARPQPFESATSKKRERLLLGSSVAAAIVASLCCILPIVAAVTGLGTIAAGAAFERGRPYLLGVTGLLLAAGFLVAYRNQKRACVPGSLCATRPASRWNLIALGSVAVLAGGFAAFPHYSGTVAKVVLGSSGSGNDSGYSVSSAALSTVRFRIPDMDCPACAVSLSATLRKLPGVADANLDTDSRRAIVTYDPAAQNVAVLEKAISDAGFHPSREPRS